MSLLDDDNTFSSNLRTYRVKAGYTQAELAKKLGMTRQNYIRYEAKSINAQPTIELLCRLAEILNTDVNALVGFKATIDLETAYRMFDVKVRKNVVHFYHTITFNKRDESGFDIMPYQKTVPIIMPKEDFDKIVLRSYKFAYEDSKRQVEEERKDYFIESVESEMYNFFIGTLLDNPEKK